MLNVSAERVAAALNRLIESPQHEALTAELRAVLEGWDMSPVTYSGEMAPLNGLLDVGIQNLRAFNKLIDLADSKRAQRAGARRVDYQREYMAERRARGAKATELRLLLKGPFRSLAAKREYQKDLQDTWRKARDEFIAAKGELDWTGRNEAAGEFWAEIDTKLAANLQAEKDKATRR